MTDIGSRSVRAEPGADAARYRVAQARQLIRRYEESVGSAPQSAADVVAWADRHRDELPLSDGRLVPFYEDPAAADGLAEAVVELLRGRIVLDDEPKSHHWMNLGREAFGLVEDGRVVAIVYWNAGGWYFVDVLSPDAHEHLVDGDQERWSEALAQAEQLHASPGGDA
jgi:hypothetical protein